MTTSSRGGWRDAVLLATGTLTVVPVPPPTTVDASRASRAMALAPVAALPLAVAVGAVVALADLLDLPTLVAALLAVGALALGTRALHLDGLADTADGLTAPYDPARRLEIMRRGDVGPAGAAALVLVIGVQAAALAGVVGRPYGWLLAGAAVVASRAAVTLACVRGVPAASRTGLGAAVAGTVPPVVAAGVWLLAAALLAGASVATDQPWWHGVLAAVAAVVVVAALVLRTVRVLGGITGDVLGAAVELCLAGVLVVLSAG